jgi:hypothetical protein
MPIKSRFSILRSFVAMRPNRFLDDIEPHGLYGVTVR